MTNSTRMKYYFHVAIFFLKGYSASDLDRRYCINQNG